MSSIEFVPGTTFEVNLPEALFKRLEKIAFDQGLTISWIIRHILENPFEFEVPRGLKRPKKMEGQTHRFPICMYGEDKRMWKMKAAGHECEFGTYLRFLLALYDDHLEEMWHSDGTVRHCEKIVMKSTSSSIANVGYGYHYLMLVPHKRFYLNLNINRTSNRRKMLFGIYKKHFSAKQIKQMLKSHYHPMVNQKS